MNSSGPACCRGWSSLGRLVLADAGNAGRRFVEGAAGLQCLREVGACVRLHSACGCGATVLWLAGLSQSAAKVQRHAPHKWLGRLL